MKHIRALAIAVSLAAAVGCTDENATSPTIPPTVPLTTVGGDSAAPTTVPDTTTPDVTMPLTEVSIRLASFVDGLEAPVDLAWRANDTTLYVVEQPGLVTPIRDGSRGESVLDVRDLVAYGGEQGLLGLAFHPTEPLAYVNYTNTSGDTVIDEFSVGADGVFDSGSRRTVITIRQPYVNHNGGDLAFGPDGFLYIGMGDGGAGGDPERYSLRVGELLGKMLRIDPRASGDQPYSVPADNPFVGVDGARPEIWSVGLRNPWRFNFDRETGDLWIGDVGQGAWEEVDVAHANEGGGRGVNFGWSALEGTHVYNSDQSADGATPPIYEYSHDVGCSISGGTVYRGDAIPSLRGWYLFSDYCSGLVIALLELPGTSPVALTIGETGNVSAIADGPDGEMYVLVLSGEVLHIDAA